MNTQNRKLHKSARDQNNSQQSSYQNFLKTFNNIQDKPKKEYSRKAEKQGRILFLILSALPLSYLLYNLFLQERWIFLSIFAVSVITAVLTNHFMVKFLRRKHPEIATKPMDVLFSDKHYSPAIISRLTTFVISCAGAFSLAHYSNVAGIYSPFVWFIVGYIFFIMLQFRKL